jgi:aspartokinase/homoserine dehydrogenase 1
MRLGRNGVNVRAIAQGSSEYNISVIISANDLSKALNAVHDAFFVQLTKTLHAFCLGTGNIGKTLFNQLNAHTDYLKDNNGIQVKIAGISNTRKMTFNSDGVSLDTWQDDLQASPYEADLQGFINKMKEMNLPNCVFIDNTASPVPIGFYEQVFKANISVITCNKIGNSGSYQQYKTFKDTARPMGSISFTKPT